MEELLAKGIAALALLVSIACISLVYVGGTQLIRKLEECWKTFSVEQRKTPECIKALADLYCTHCKKFKKLILIVGLIALVLTVIPLYLKSYSEFLEHPIFYAMFAVVSTVNVIYTRQVDKKIKNLYGEDVSNAKEASEKIGWRIHGRTHEYVSWLVQCAINARLVVLDLYQF